MINLSANTFSHAHEIAVTAWSSPNKRFTSGMDVRTSENALLAQLYGGLVHASRFNWLNAGRRLIDKTYIHMLLVSQGLSELSFTTPEQASARLDNFIQQRLAREWEQITSTRQDIQADSWLKQVADTVFNSGSSEAAASHLMFFLCPSLPFKPFNRGYQMALQRLGFACRKDDYSDYSSAFDAALVIYAERLNKLSLPVSVFGSESERKLIDDCLQATDWWQRRVFSEILRQDTLQQHGDEALTLLGCTKEGAITSYACSA